MLANRLIFVCLFGLLAAGCTTIDKQTTQSVVAVKEKNSKRVDEKSADKMPEVLAFAPKIKTHVSNILSRIFLITFTKKCRARCWIHYSLHRTVK